MPGDWAKKPVFRIWTGPKHAGAAVSSGPGRRGAIWAKIARHIAGVLACLPQFLAPKQEEGRSMSHRKRKSK